jgi:hypothetical protein
MSVCRRSELLLPAPRVGAPLHAAPRTNVVEGLTPIIYSVTRREVPSFDDVVRHRCHNGLCVNPEHLEVGTRADNKRDDWGYAASGLDHDMLKCGIAS